jgi:trans-aconitate 2-methyltransferase
MTIDVWQPDLYDRFAAERRLPFFDLAAMVAPEPGMRVLDLGCGTGALTRQLHRQLMAAETVGLEKSEAMWARCVQHGADDVHFVHGDMAALLLSGELPGLEPPYDLVFSNAALHWLEDHDTVLAQVVGLLSSNGQLAIQVPANHEHPSQVVAAEVATQAPFAEALGGYVRRSPVLSVERYAERLHELGMEEQQVLCRVYGHQLPSRDSVVDWVRGTTLTDYQRRMSPEVYDAFLAAYVERLRAVLPEEQPFFFPFSRIFLWARNGQTESPKTSGRAKT